MYTNNLNRPSVNTKPIYITNNCFACGAHVIFVTQCSEQWMRLSKIRETSNPFKANDMQHGSFECVHY
jgi:hypothetical protein